MGRRKSRKPESISLAALGLLVAAVLFAGIPSSSADITAGGATSQPKKQRSWPWNEQSPPAKPSSVVFPVYGAVYPLGFYYVAINIGDPPRPYFLDVDTGSDVTWIQCDAPCVRCYQGPHPPYRPAKNRLVPCDDPLCSLVQESTNHKGGCESPSQCDYEVEYADHGSSLGVLVHDAFALRLANSSLARPSLAFGCGYDQQGVPSTNGRVPTDGVLGLGSGKVSVLSQLREIGLCRNVVGHCLGRRGAGYLFFGDEVVPTHGVTWVPMSTDPVNKYYSPGMASIFAGKQQLSAKQLVVFDSGSSYTYFTNQLYQPLLSAIHDDVSKGRLKEAHEEKALPLCWKGARPFKSALDLRKYFRSLVIGFGNGKAAATMEVPAENYFIITKQGNACLGVLNGTQIGLGSLNVIGDISMQDLMVVYDNERRMIGWARGGGGGCDRIPNDEDEGRMFEQSISYQPQFPGVHQEYCPAQ